MSTDGINLSIHGGTLKEFFDRFESFARRFGYVLAVSPSAVAEEVTTGGVADEPATEDLFPRSDNVGAESANAAMQAPVRRRPGRPRGAVRSAATMDAVEATIAVELPPATLDDAKDAGRVVIHKGGVDALRGLLTEFGIDKIAELKKETWPRFIARCHEVSEGGA